MMIHMDVPDRLPPEIAIPGALILWIIFILVVLIQRKRAQIRQQKALRQTLMAGRREAYIEAANAQDDALNEELDKRPRKRDRR